ncbi:CX3C chemokine receptor 1-like [Saccostrea echinata]|uniref:CX3C chemokine receptor 1-like n=1 Tax=Saccostrea echinata TaxID=191078 RepID=UPI002A7F09D3|nr:CX3C chemokine receptor 1-like [Saccostrea echinata]
MIGFLSVNGTLGTISLFMDFILSQNKTDFNEEIKRDMPIYLHQDHFVLVVTITVLGIIGNVLPLVKMTWNKNFQGTVFVVIRTIIITDIVNLILYLVHAGFELDDFRLEKVPCATFLVVFYGVAHTSAAHVVFLFGLRCYMVSEPIKFNQLRKRTIIVSSAAIWVLSILFSIFYFVLRYKSGIQTPSYVIIVFRVYLIIVPVLLIIFFHVKKIHRLKSTLSKHNIEHNIIKMSLVMSLILIVYMSSAILFLVCYILSLYRFKSTEKQFLIVAQLAWLLNAVLSPFIYVVSAPSFHKYFKYLITTVQTMKCLADQIETDN